MLRHQRDAASLGRDPGGGGPVTGRVALPAAWLGARARAVLRPVGVDVAPPADARPRASFPLMRRMYRRADAVLTYGEHVSRYVAQRRGSDRNVFVAPQAVEADSSVATSTRPSAPLARLGRHPPGARLVLYVGRLVPEKGVETLLDAWEAARRDGEVLCLAGEGPLRGRASGPHVVYPGHVDRAALPAAYAAADAVVVPSLHTRAFLEPWGLVCNEAMHQGRPVIATTAVGAAAGGLVRDGETGLVVPAGDPVALAAAIRRLLGDPALRERLGANAREAVAPFSHEAAADAFGKRCGPWGCGGDLPNIPRRWASPASRSSRPA